MTDVEKLENLLLEKDAEIEVMPQIIEQLAPMQRFWTDIQVACHCGGTDNDCCQCDGSGNVLVRRYRVSNPEV